MICFPSLENEERKLDLWGDLSFPKITFQESVSSLQDADFSLTVTNESVRSDLSIVIKLSAYRASLWALESSLWSVTLLSFLAFPTHCAGFQVPTASVVLWTAESAF